MLDYRPSTVAVAAVLAAAHGAMAREALESRMSSLAPSCCLLDKVRARTHSVFFPTRLELMKSHIISTCNLILPVIDQDDVHACYSAMLSERSSSATPSKQGAAKRPPPSSSSSGSTTYDSVDAAASFAAAADSNKRARLVELPAVGR